jgi:hypothetical protein
MIADSITRDSMRAVRRQRAIERGDTATTKSAVNTPFKALNRRLTERTEEWSKLPPEESARKMRTFLIQRGPTVIFLLLPIFALLLKLFYWRSRRFYAEHFVFALHTHTFGYFIFTFILLLPRAGSQKYPILALMAWLAGYLWLALKRTYEQGWIRTTLKFGVIGFAYSFLLIAGFTLEVVAAMLFA